MRLRKLFSAMAVIVIMPASALAAENGFFTGLDLSAGLASGVSSTTDGGAAFAGGGVVRNVAFGAAMGVGGHIGYRLDPSLAGSISYEHIRGGIAWDAEFPLFGVASGFRGDAISNVVMGNIVYDLALSDQTTLEARAGLGISINSLSGVVETDGGTGDFLSDVADQSRLSPAVRIGAGLQHRIGSNATLGLDAGVSYVGGFETGDTRSGNLGVTAITPYRIDDVWRASLGASIRFAF